MQLDESCRPLAGRTPTLRISIVPQTVIVTLRLTAQHPYPAGPVARWSGGWAPDTAGSACTAPATAGRSRASLASRRITARKVTASCRINRGSSCSLSH
jgi:hypothetical protein